MSWVNDLASVLGIPAGAATAAVAMQPAPPPRKPACYPAILKRGPLNIGR